MTAQVCLVVFDKNDPSDNDERVAIMGGHFDIFNKSGGRIAMLECCKFDNKSHVLPQNVTLPTDAKLLQLSMGFIWPANDKIWINEQPLNNNVSTRQLDAEMVGVVIWFPGCKVPLQIFPGHV